MSDSTVIKPTPGSVIDQIIQKAADMLPQQPVIIQVVNWLPGGGPPMEFLIRSIEDFTLGPLPNVKPVWVNATPLQRVNFRYYPSTKAPSYGLLNPGDVLWVLPEVFKVSEGFTWLFVNKDTIYGWVASEFVKVDEKAG